MSNELGGLGLNPHSAMKTHQGSRTGKTLHKFLAYLENPVRASISRFWLEDTQWQPTTAEANLCSHYLLHTKSHESRWNRQSQRRFLNTAMLRVASRAYIHNRTATNGLNSVILVIWEYFTTFFPYQRKVLFWGRKSESSDWDLQWEETRMIN